MTVRPTLSILVLTMVGAGWGCGATVRTGDSDVQSDDTGGPEVLAQTGATVFPLQVMDAAGNSVTFEAPPARILSLVPSATRALQSLGLESRLVGRTEYDDSSELDHLPSVGGGLNPNLEAIALLEPDLVIRFAGESDPDTPRRLTDLGIAHFAIRLDQVADVEALLANLGTITAKEEESRALIREIQDTLQSIRQAVKGRKVVRVAYVLGGNPPWVAGSDTYISELLVYAGGENVFYDLGDLYGPVSPEAFLVRDIDLLLAPEGVEIVLPGKDILLKRVPPGLELPGPDLPHAARAVAQLLHPEAFQ